MLQVSFLREEKERVLEGLKKRNFKQLELVDEAIQLDDERKKTQQELDSIQRVFQRTYYKTFGNRNFVA